MSRRMANRGNYGDEPPPYNPTSRPAPNWSRTGPEDMPSQRSDRIDNGFHPSSQSVSRQQLSTNGHQSPDDTAPTPNDIVVAVMGVTGAGKTTFIQHFCPHNLNVGHGLESCTSKVEVIPCRLADGRKIFLIDTPGFDDTYRSDTDILRDVADWLSTSYQNMIKLSGIIYLHRISDVRIGGSGMKNLRMFRKLCGEKGLGSVVLATTMWSMCPVDDARRREDQLVKQNDLWKFLMGHGARVFRQDNGNVSGQQIIDYLINRGQTVTLAIQHEMVNQGMKLSETEAGREVTEELERMKQKHEKEMAEIRQEMEEAVRQKDEERQEELREYKQQIDRQMAQSAAQARQLESSREQLRTEMKAQHEREMQELKSDIHRRQRELDSKEKMNQDRYDKLVKELSSLKEKAQRQNMTEWTFHAKFNCPGCGTGWLYKETLPPAIFCRVCRRFYPTV